MFNYQSASRYEPAFDKILPISKYKEDGNNYSNTSVLKLLEKSSELTHSLDRSSPPINFFQNQVFFSQKTDESAPKRPLAYETAQNRAIRPNLAVQVDHLRDGKASHPVRVQDWGESMSKLDNRSSHEAYIEEDLKKLYLEYQRLGKEGPNREFTIQPKDLSHRQDLQGSGWRPSGIALDSAKKGVNDPIKINSSGLIEYGYRDTANFTPLQRKSPSRDQDQNRFMSPLLRAQPHGYANESPNTIRDHQTRPDGGFRMIGLEKALEQETENTKDFTQLDVPLFRNMFYHRNADQSHLLEINGSSLASSEQTKNSLVPSGKKSTANNKVEMPFNERRDRGNGEIPKQTALLYPENRKLVDVNEVPSKSSLGEELQKKNQGAEGNTFDYNEHDSLRFLSPIKKISKLKTEETEEGESGFLSVKFDFSQLQQRVGGSLQELDAEKTFLTKKASERVDKSKVEGENSVETRNKAEMLRQTQWNQIGGSPNKEDSGRKSYSKPGTPKKMIIRVPKSINPQKEGVDFVSSMIQSKASFVMPMKATEILDGSKFRQQILERIELYEKGLANPANFKDNFAESRRKEAETSQLYNSHLSKTLSMLHENEANQIVEHFLKDTLKKEVFQTKQGPIVHKEDELRSSRISSIGERRRHSASGGLGGQIIPSTDSQDNQFRNQNYLQSTAQPEKMNNYQATEYQSNRWQPIGDIGKSSATTNKHTKNTYSVASIEPLSTYQKDKMVPWTSIRLDHRTVRQSLPGSSTQNFTSTNIESTQAPSRPRIEDKVQSLASGFQYPEDERSGFSSANRKNLEEPQHNYPSNPSKLLALPSRTGQTQNEQNCNSSSPVKPSSSLTSPRNGTETRLSQTGKEPFIFSEKRIAQNTPKEWYLSSSKSTSDLLKASPTNDNTKVARFSDYFVSQAQQPNQNTNVRKSQPPRVRASAEPIETENLTSSIEVNGSYFQEKVQPRNLPHTIALPRQNFCKFYDPKMKIKVKMDAFCMVCEDFISLEKVDSHSKQCTTKIDQCLEPGKAIFNLRETVGKDQTNVEDCNHNIERIVVKLNESLKKIGVAKNIEFTETSKQLVRVARDVISENFNSKIVNRKMQEFDKLFEPLSNNTKGEEIGLLCYLQRLFVALREKDHALKAKKNEENGVMDLKAGMRALESDAFQRKSIADSPETYQYQSLLLQEIEKNDVKSIKDLKHDLTREVEVLSQIYSDIAESPDVSDLSAETSESDEMQADSPLQGAQDVKEEHRRLFYTEAANIKLKLPANHPGKDRPIAELYQECLKYKITQKGFSAFICKQFNIS